MLAFHRFVQLVFFLNFLIHAIKIASDVNLPSFRYFLVSERALHPLFQNRSDLHSNKHQTKVFFYFLVFILQKVAHNLPHSIHINPVLTSFQRLRFLQCIKYTTPQNILPIITIMITISYLITHLSLPIKPHQIHQHFLHPLHPPTPLPRPHQHRILAPQPRKSLLIFLKLSFTPTPLTPYARPNRLLRLVPNRSSRQNRPDPRPQLSLIPFLRFYRRIHQSPRQIRSKPQHQLAVQRARQHIFVVLAEHLPQRRKRPGSGPKRPRERAKSRGTGAIGHPFFVST